MSLISAVKPSYKPTRLKDLIRDFTGYVTPFIDRIDEWYNIPPFLFLKTIEYSIYKFYEPRNESWRNYKYELIFKISSRCTDRCPKCGVWKQPEYSRVSIERVIQTVRSIGRNLWSVTITGGEPLLFMNDVLRLSEVTAEMGIPTTIVTNGFLITEEFLQRVRALKRNLFISIDTIDERRWVQFRGRHHYKKVMENLARAVEIVGENLSVQSVLAQETVNDVPLVADFCLSQGISHHIQNYQDFGGIWHPTKPIQNENNPVPCSAWLNICLLPNGDVVKCFDHVRIPSAREPLGNINTDSIESIFGNQRTAEITRIMRRCNLPCKMLRCNQK